MKIDLFDEYLKILSDNGYIEDDFEITQIDNSPSPQPIGNGISEQDPYIDLLVKNKKTGKSKTYTMLKGMEGAPDWTIEFEKNLRGGIFK